MPNFLSNEIEFFDFDLECREKRTITKYICDKNLFYNASNNNFIKNLNRQKLKPNTLYKRFNLKRI